MGLENTQLKVLLVEDSEDDRFFFQYAFKRAQLNAQLFIATDGLEAIEFLKAEVGAPGRPRFPDVIFLDLKMPEVDGFDVMRWMHKESLFPLTKVFILSGSDEPSDIKLARELGASQYLVKHVKFDVLHKLLAPQPLSPEKNPESSKPQQCS